MRWASAWMLVCAAWSAGCGTIELGDDIVPPNLQLDEDFFHCEIQPNVLTAKSCADGIDGEGGSCHADRSALRLVATTDPPPMCEDGVIVGGSIPADSIANFEAVRFTVQSDPLSSPFFRRPTGMDSHPRVVFPAEGDPCADLVMEWITRGGM